MKQPATIASLCLLVAIVIAGTLTLRDYGMGWDEVYRWKSGDSKLTYYLTLWEDKSWSRARELAGVDHYPGLFDLSLAIVHHLTGADRLPLGHAWSFLFGLTGLIALWASGRMLESSSLGFWACLFLILTPPFYGHWFHNPKDIPFAAMTSLALLASIGLVRNLPKLAWKWIFFCGFAIGLAMAVRVAGIVFLCYLAAAFLWFRIQYGSGGEEVPSMRRWIPTTLGVLAAIGLAAGATLLPWWPAAHGSPLSSTGETFVQLHDRAASIPLLFRGEVIDAGEAPRTYALWMLWIKTPESFLLLLLAAPFLALTSMKRQGWISWLRALRPGWLIVLLSGLFPLLYFTVMAPALHDGARHFLFVYPPLALLAAWSWLRLSERVRQWRPPWIRPLYIALAGLLLIQLGHLIALHPYQYVYYNRIIGGPAGAHGRYQTEYWLTAQTHAIEWLNDYWREHRRWEPGLPAAPYFATGPFHLSEHLAPSDLVATKDPGEARFYVGTTEMMGHLLFDGEVLYRIERMGLPLLEIRDLRSTSHPPSPESQSRGRDDGSHPQGSVR